MESGQHRSMSANAEPEHGTSKSESNWEMTPSGMLVQRREEDKVNQGPIIKVHVSYGSSLQEIYVPAYSTFGSRGVSAEIWRDPKLLREIKKSLAQKVGLEPQEQRLFFRGRETQDDEKLNMAGLKNNSKLLLMEHPASKEKKREELKKMEEINKASEAVARVRAEVDKLYERVAALEAAVQGGSKVADNSFVETSELLMRQLLKLDGIEAEGEARAHRKAEVRRVQGFVDAVDALKARNSNPLSANAVSVTTNWEKFESGVGSLSAPPPMPSSTNTTKENWEQID